MTKLAWFGRATLDYYPILPSILTLPIPIFYLKTESELRRKMVSFGILRCSQFFTFLCCHSAIDAHERWFLVVKGSLGHLSPP